MGYCILKPKNLNLEERIRQFPPDFEFKIDYAYLVINDIIKSTSYKVSNHLKENGINWQDFRKSFNIKDFFIAKCSTEMQAFERQYNKHLNYLYQNFSGAGRVLWRENYSEGNCFSYQLSPYYFDSDLELYEITDKKLIRKIKVNDRLRDRTGRDMLYLKKFFDPHKLTILLPEAFEAIEIQLKETGNRNKYFINAVKLLDLHNGSYHFSLNPETDGRFHSNITTFPKELRKFLRYEGKILAEIDLSSSIPFFLYYHLKYLNFYNKHISKILSPNKSYYNPYMLVKNKLIIDNEEVKRFGESVSHGSFYSDLENDFWNAHHIEDANLQPDQYFLGEVTKLFGREFDGDHEDLVKVMKTNLLSMMNAKPNIYRVEEAVFFKHYPSISNFIKAFKRKKYTHDRHVKFSHLLFQTEAYFMIRTMAKKALRKFKRMPLFTLHDCYITTKENIDALGSYMRDFFSSELGIVPNMKIKVWE
ncbi:hypothetical protein [Flavobacterium sp.]|uniref:hypothetical protein n=1 Tax=Flavobacterium sp. TaxID=239 RepID=UPI003A9252B8